MCRGLGPDHGLDLAYPLCADTNMIFARRFFGSFVVVVTQNSFPILRRSAIMGVNAMYLLGGSRTNYRCSVVASGLRLALDFFYISQA
jgi:hypothetical protein